MVERQWMDPGRVEAGRVDAGGLEQALQQPWFESPLFDVEQVRARSGDEVARISSQLATDGFAVIPGAVPDDLVESALDQLVGRFEGTSRQQDLWRSCTAVREIACLTPILDLLQSVYRRRPIPFQTLNFDVGTEQAGHSDAVHFSSVPAGFMCGVWVALEDVDSGNGPLFYHPGSHRLPPATLQRFGLPGGWSSYDEYADRQAELLDVTGQDPVEFHARRGDALIWTSNLVHGGRPILQPGRTRWSQVTHYFFDGCFYVSPVLSEPELGEWFVRTSLVDISTGEVVEHSYLGSPIFVEPIGHGRSRVLTVHEVHDPEFEPEGSPRIVMQPHQVDLLHELDAIKRSRSYRIAQGISAPVRAARQLLGRSGGTGSTPD